MVLRYRERFGVSTFTGGLDMSGRDILLRQPQALPGKVPYFLGIFLARRRYEYLVLFKKLDQDALVVGPGLFKHPALLLFRKALPGCLKRFGTEVEQSMLLADRHKLLVSALAPPVSKLLDNFVRFAR